MPAHVNGPGTGFIGLNSYLDANQPTLQRETAALTGDVANKFGDAKAATDKYIGDWRSHEEGWDPNYVAPPPPGSPGGTITTGSDEKTPTKDTSHPFLGDDSNPDPSNDGPIITGGGRHGPWDKVDPATADPNGGLKGLGNGTTSDPGRPPTQVGPTDPVAAPAKPHVDNTDAGDFANAQSLQGTAMDSLGQVKAGGLNAANTMHAKYGKENGGYSAADSSFDASLFGADAGTQKAFADTTAKYGGLGSYLEDQAAANPYVVKSAATPAAAPVNGAKPVVATDPIPLLDDNSNPLEHNGGADGGVLSGSGKGIGGIGRPRKSKQTDDLP